MTTYVLLPTVDGPPYYVNPELVVSLTAAPTTPAGTFVDVQGDAPSRIVAVGTPAAVAALLAAAATGGTIGPRSTVYVEPPSPAGRGNDATGERGNAAKPYTTLTAAFAAMQNGDTIELAAGSYAPPSGPIPASLLQGCIVAPSGAGRTVIDGSGTALPCLNFSGTARELWNVFDVRFQHDPGQQCIRADGTGAPALSFFTQGSLSFLRCVFIEGDVLARYVGTLVHGASVAPSGGTWVIDTCNNVIFSTAQLIGGIAMELTANNDDPLAPRNGSAPLGAVRFDGASVFPGGTITIGEQGSLYAAPGSVLGQVNGFGLTKSVPNGFFSQVTILGAVQAIDFSNVGAFPDAQGVVDLRGATIGNTCNIANAPGSVNTLNVAAGGAVFGSFVTIGEATRADMRTASFAGGILAQLTTPSTGQIIPPTFGLPPVPVVAAPGLNSFALPFRLASANYAVTLDYDDASTGKGAVNSRTATGFDVVTIGPAAGQVRPVVEYYGS